MTDYARRLDIGGYRPEPEYWQVRQVGEPEPEPQYRAPAMSRAVGYWFNRLRDRKRPTPYQICLAMHIAEAGRRR
jgi:hypothetical protein